jgi:hypothetical protein
MNDYDMDILRLAHEGYCCAQIILHMALDVQGLSNPGLIRAMSGLCHGFTFTKGTCGALTGAACLIAYHAGKGKAEEDAHHRLPLMLSELSEWFEQTVGTRFGGINCSNIVSDGRPDTTLCGGLVADCYGRAMTILVANGFDPAGYPDD